MSLRVKICGLTREVDVTAAVDAGADSVGFVLAPSPRRVSIDRAKKLALCVPPLVAVVAVVSDPPPELIDEIVKCKLFDLVQFHGNEDPSLISNCPLKSRKAIAVGSEEDLKLIPHYEDVANFILLDSKRGKLKGGTGTTFDWQLIKKFNFKKPFILAGGIGPENVEQAVKFLNPRAIDANSALEVSPGLKDETKIKELMKKIKELNGFKTQTGGIEIGN